MWRWFVNNDYGRPIAMSCRGFWSKEEAEQDLMLFQSLMNLEAAV
jgi:hypothetical protein